MWQAGWHFTQWQHIACSLLLLSLFSSLVFVIVFSLFCLFCFLLFEDFLSLHFLCYAFKKIKNKIQPFPVSAPCLSWLFTLLFFSSTTPLALSASFFLSVTFSQSVLPPPLFHVSDGCVEKLVARLKKHPGEFLASCVHACGCACMRAHNGVSCLFNATYIPQLPPQWPILCGSC